MLQMYADLTKTHTRSEIMIKMTTKDPAGQLETNLKFQLDTANEKISKQANLITALTARLKKVTDVVDGLNKADYRGTIKKYADPKKVTNIDLEAMDAEELEQMANIFKLIKRPVAGVDFDIEEGRSSVQTVPSRFKYGDKPTD